MGQQQGYGTDFKQGNRPIVQRVVEPSEALNEVLVQNRALKQQNDQLAASLQQLQAQAAQQDRRLAKLAPFESIVNTPIAKLKIDLDDPFVIGQLRQLLILIYGQSIRLDAKGENKTAAFSKLKVVVSHCLRYALQHSHIIRGQVLEAERISAGVK